MINILLVTQDDPFYLPIFFQELLNKDFSKKGNIIGIIIQPPLGKRSISKLIFQMINFYGYINFIVNGFKFIIYKFMNFIAMKIFNGKFPGTFSVKHIIKKQDIDIIEIKNINARDSLDLLRKLNIDVIFSIAASQIFKKEILELPRIGCFNIHTSKLPKNRGMMPNFWSLYNYNSDPVSAITIHRMNEKLDDGEILIQKEFKLDPEESLDFLIRKTKKMSAELFLQAIDILGSKKITYIKNDAACATYNTFPSKNDVKKFKERGLKLS